MIRPDHHHPDDEAVARWAEHALASVYRVLDLPAGPRLVHRIDLGGGVARYEPALPGGEHHHHLVCVNCGAVRPFEDAALEQALQGSADASDDTVEGHDVTLRGRCPDCRAAVAAGRSGSSLSALSRHVPRSEWDVRRVRESMIPLDEVPLLGRERARR